MTRRLSLIAVGVLGLVSATLLITSIVLKLGIVTGALARAGAVITPVSFMFYSAVGALIVLRRGNHSIGWIFCIAGAYIGLVFGFQAVLAPFTAESDLAIAASTLGVAALFRPVRSRVQDFIDRRFYRRKFDAQQTVEQFSAHLRDEVELASISDQLVDVIRNTMQPAHVSVWLVRGSP